MRLFHFTTHSACGIAAAAAILAACTPSTVITPATRPVAQAALRAHATLTGERFTSASATNHCTKGNGGAIFLSFAAKGNASGPFPGTYKLTGEATLTSTSPNFSETYSIKSGSQTIRGSATTTTAALMKLTCNTKIHKSVKSKITGAPYDVFGSKGTTSLTLALRTFKQTFR